MAALKGNFLCILWQGYLKTQKVVDFDRKIGLFHWLIGMHAGLRAIVMECDRD